MSANFKLIDFFWLERMPLVHVGLLIFHRMHFAIENVTNRIFFGLGKQGMSCKKQMRRRRGISVQKGGKFEHTYNQQSFSLSKKLSLGQKQFFDEWVMFELCILNAHGALWWPKTAIHFLMSCFLFLFSFFRF